MRRSITTACAMVFALLGAAACGRAPAAQEGIETAATPGSRVDVVPTIAVAPPTTATSSSASSSGAPVDDGGGEGSGGSSPYGPEGEAGCIFGVSGSVTAWVDNSSTWAWAWPGGSIQCSGTVAGVGHDVNLALGDVTGPGVYPSLQGTQYGREWCVGKDSSTCTSQTFAPSISAGSGCVATLTEAPSGFVVGAKIAGTFSCADMVDTTDATESVAVYEGSFWAVLMPPPE